MALNVIQYMQWLLYQYDPSIDVTEGSKAYTEIIAPLASRLYPQLTQTTAAKFLKTRLTEEFPELDGYGFDDTTFKPAQVLATSVQRAIARVEQVNASPRFENLTIEEARARAAMFFVYGTDGTRTQVTMRVYFATLQDRLIPYDSVFHASSAIRFYPIEPRTVYSEEQSQDAETGEYYIDVLCFAEEAGQRFNVPANSVKSFSGIPGAVRCTNPSRPSVDGVDMDDQEDLYNLVKNHAERSLTKEGGIALYVEETFPSLFDKVRVVKTEDDEMVRDRLTPTVEIIGGPILFGPILAANTNGRAVKLTYLSGAVVSPVTDTFEITEPDDWEVMEVGGVITIDNVDYTVLSVGNAVDMELTLSSVEILSYGTDLYWDFAYTHGRYLLRTDELKSTSGALSAETGAKVWADRIVPETYDVTTTDWHVRVTPVIDFLLSYDFDTSNQTYFRVEDDEGGTYWEFPIEPTGGPPAGGTADGVYFTFALYGTDNPLPDPLPTPDTYEVAANLGTIVWDGNVFGGNGGYIFKILKTTLDANAYDESGPAVPGDIAGEGFDFTLHTAGPGSEFAVADGGAAEGPMDFVAYKIVDGALPHSDGAANVSYTYRGAAVTINDISFRLNGYTYDDGYIPLGGMTDLYIRDKETGAQASNLDPLFDDDQIAWGTCEIQGHTTDNKYSVVGVPLDEDQSAILRNDLLFIEDEGSDDYGGHRILEKKEIASVAYLRVKKMQSAASTNLAFHVSRSIEIDMFEPEELRVTGTDLTTMLESSVATTSEDLTDVVAGEDTLRISEGPDSGDYDITAKDGVKLTVDGTFTEHQEDLAFTIVSSKGDLVRRPLVRVTQLDRAGSIIPYAYPSIAYLIRSIKSKTIVPNDTYDGTDASIDGTATIEFDDIDPVDLNVSIGDYILIKGSWNKITAVSSGPPASVTVESAPSAATESDVAYSIGTPSRGTLRLLFTDPVYTWVPSDQRFTYSSASFRVDPTYEEAVGSVMGSFPEVADTTFTIDTDDDVVDLGVEAGDRLRIATKVIQSISLPSGADVGTKILNITVAGTTYTVHFYGDNPIPLSNYGNPLGIVEQIKLVIPSLTVWEDGDVLKMASSSNIEVSNCSAGDELGISGENNELTTGAGVYVVDSVLGAYTDMTTWASPATYVFKIDTVTTGSMTTGEIAQASIVRRGAAKIQTLERADGLYEADIEIESIGFGDTFDLAAGTVLSTTDPIEGFYFNDVDEGLSFSTREEGNMVIRAVVPSAKGYILVDKVTASYRYAPNLPALQSHLDLDSVRHVDNNILCKSVHEAPIHRSVDATGITTRSYIATGVKNWIRRMDPGATIEVFDMHRAMSRSGATDATEPSPIFTYYDDATRQRVGVVVVDSETLPKSVLPVVGVIE